MIVHLDMDAFFASVEQMDNPYLRGKPVIIGGGERGVVATASYEARIYGIHSAMPSALARKLCPNGIFIRGRHQRYSEVSRKIMQALAAISPVVQPASIDEAYLDASNISGGFRNPLELALTIKASVARASGGLTCSVGIAPIKFLAKICSDTNKPNGVCIVEQDEMDNFLISLPVEKLPGVGKRMRQSLKSIGINTVAELRQLSRDFLQQSYGKFGAILYDRAYGIDTRIVHAPLPAKSEGVERTLEKNTRDRAFLSSCLKKHAEKISARLGRNCARGRTITLKLKFADFRQITRCRTLDFRTAEAEIIFETANALFLAEKLPEPVRLIGISVSGFEPKSEQLVLPGVKLRKT
jgi:DNA polymerase-4